MTEHVLTINKNHSLIFEVYPFSPTNSQGFYAGKKDFVCCMQAFLFLFWSGRNFVSIINTIVSCYKMQHDIFLLIDANQGL